MLLDILAAIFLAALSVTIIAGIMSQMLKKFSNSVSETKIALASNSILEQLAHSKTPVNQDIGNGVRWDLSKQCSEYDGKHKICKITLTLKAGALSHVIESYVE